MNDTALGIVLVIVGVVAAIFLLMLVFNLLSMALVGAVSMFAYASEQDFVGIAVYFACWVFLFPLMLVACIIAGIFTIYTREQ